ncbi:MAG: B12-binding domain-containing radical SAM protein [Rhodospirillaceae bacterium]
MEQTKIGLVQINGGFAGQSWVPYSVGMLQSYAVTYSSRPESYEFLTPIFKREPVRDIVSKLAQADIVAISLYTWNEGISLEVARRVKEQSPDTLIIVGGPQVPSRSDEFLADNAMIDVVVHAEGERVFLDLLESYPSNDWTNISSVSYRINGEVVTTLGAPRLRNLDDIPSPYLTGVFDKLFEENPDEKWTALWETNRGCPFSCTFCDWGSNTASKVARFGTERLLEEIEWFSHNRIPFIYCCDANFGILPRDETIAEQMAEQKRRSGYPVIFSVQNTKNATGRSFEVQKILSDAGLSKGVSLSMQSTNPKTLEIIRRANISLDSYQTLQERFTHHNIETYSELILGLPGDTYDTFASSVDDLISNGQHNRIRFNNLSILPNAEMGDPRYQKTHKMETVRIPVVNGYGENVEHEDDVQEYQYLVVSTKTMPPAEWRKTRVFAWMADFLHFDKMLQIPMVMVNQAGEGEYRSIIEYILDADASDYPLIAEVGDFLRGHAQAIQSGSGEYYHEERFLNSFWKPDEIMVMRIVADGRIDQFYDESKRLLLEYVAASNIEMDELLIDEAIHLNKVLLKVPFVGEDLVVPLKTQVLDLWESVVKVELNGGRASERVRVLRAKDQWQKLDDWCREVVWFGNRTGSYFYETERAPTIPKQAGEDIVSEVERL